MKKLCFVILLFPIQVTTITDRYITSSMVHQYILCRLLVEMKYFKVKMKAWNVAFGYIMLIIRV